MKTLDLSTGFSQSASEAADDGSAILRKPYQPDEMERQIVAVLRALEKAAANG